MEITAQILNDLNTTLQAGFNTGLTEAQPQYDMVAMTIRSAAASNTYPDFTGWSNFREWVGAREFGEIKAAAYQIFNKTYEASVKAKREDIEDNNLGFLAYQARAAGQAAPQFIDELLFTLLRDGNKDTNLCHDGNPFFSTEHKGKGTSKQSNIIQATGSGDKPIKAIVLDTTKILKPAIVQMRRDFAMTSRTNLTDDNVFHQNEFLWGIDGRMNVGYGPWFTAVGSEEAFDASVYAEARKRLASFKTADGRPYNCRSTTVLVGPSGEAAAREVLVADRNANGASNIWNGTAQVIVVPYLD